MTGLNWVDAVLVAGAVLVGLAGWRAGVITTAAAFVGFLGGAMLAAWLMPQVLADVSWPSFAVAIVALGAMLVLGLVGQSLLGWVGRMVRDALDFRPVRLIDSASGMVVSGLAFLISAWLLLSVAASMPQGNAAEAVRSSRSFGFLEQLMAGPGGVILDDARALLGALNLPALPFNPAALPPVADPVDVDIPDSVVQVARRSVLRVVASSGRCGFSMVGSAVVVGPERVATNAHVIAGSDRVEVRPYDGGRERPGRLVYRDTARDLAILYVPGLDAPAPQWRRSAPRGTDAAVAGYPGGGSLRLRPARVRGMTKVENDTGEGVREVVVLRGVVQPGNSGGPLLDLSGNVLGLVFANSSLDGGTGFALAPSEVVPVIEATRTDTEQVSAGSCAAR